MPNPKKSQTPQDRHHPQAEGRPLTKRHSSGLIPVPPAAFLDHPIEYLHLNPNASVVTPLGPKPLKIRLTLNSLHRKRVEWLATKPGYRGRNPREGRQMVLHAAVVIGLGALEEQEGVGR